MSAIIISSDTVLTSFDHHFRVFAGPGAGKTYWLVNHIVNVIRNSKRITPSSYVACISYTNVAVGEIIKGLGRSAEHAEVSTIHSFLYRNVVKPYLHLLKDEKGEPLVNYALVDGHDEHKPIHMAVKKGWLDSIGAKLDFYSKQHEIFAYLKKLTWQRDNNTGNWSLRPHGWVPHPKYLPTSQLHLYKPFYWREGVIDHEDVLYFAYRILEEFPLVQEFLSLRFPYLFVDEFQDTNPIQTQVIKWLANHYTLVGVIGDVEQSIYGFQGARPEDFDDFNLPGQLDYLINDNRRSTDAIIQLLNHVRGGSIEQKGLRQIAGEPVRIYVGDVIILIPHLYSQLSPGDQIVILARKNLDVASIRRLTSSRKEDLWDQLSKIDVDRFHFLEHLIAGGELAKLQHYSLAVIRLLRGLRMSRAGSLKEPFKFNRNVTKLECRGLAVSLLNFVINNYSQLRQSSLLNVYQQISDLLSETIHGLSLRAAKAGGFRNFADSTTYGMLADGLRLPDETRATRTIHQAKSAEFSNVLVSLDKEGLNHILDPKKKRDGANAEEKRVTYVAISRARDRLFISVSELPEEDGRRLEDLGLEVVRLDHVRQTFSSCSA